jgi:Spy/CpxP family protein refolding chaperone
MNTRKPLLPLIAAVLFMPAPAAWTEDVDMVSGASTTQYSGSMQHPHGENGEMMAHWGDELGLTGQQKTDIQIIIADYMPRYRDLAKIGRETATGLMRMSPDDPQYITETQKASATAASSAAELVTLMSEMRGKLHAVLSSEQRLKLQELLQSRPHPAHEENPEP